MGTVQGVNSEDCYYFAASPAMWLQAEENCMAREGHLTSVSSAMSNGILRQIGGLSSTTEFWLGASWDTQLAEQWAWTDGRRFQYFNWATGQPTNIDSYCASMDMSNGRWHSRPCKMRKPYICKVPAVDSCPPSSACPTATATATSAQCPACPSITCSTPSFPPITCPTTCPRGWTHVAETSKCLRITNVPGLWNDLEAQCKEFGGDLVSVHSKASNYAIRDFVFRTLAVLNTSYTWYAIGLFIPTQGVRQWQWTDDSSADFTNWGADASPSYNATFVGAVGSEFNASYYEAYNGYWGVLAETEDSFKGVCQL